MKVKRRGKQLHYQMTVFVYIEVHFVTYNFLYVVCVVGIYSSSTDEIVDGVFPMDADFCVCFNFSLR